MLKSLSIYYQANVLKVCLYGLISGMNLLLSGNSINFWLANVGIDTKIIGFFSCIALPYALKYFIAIFIDKHRIPFLSKKIDQHKAWLIASQLMLVLSLLILSFLKPTENLWLIAITGFFIALFAVVQDIVLNANRIKILENSQQGLGTALYSIGYRIGMLFTGAGVVFASAYISWANIYLTLAAIYLILAVILVYSYLGQKNQNIIQEESKTLWHNIFIKPFEHFLNLKNFIWVILFIIIYRLADNMLIVMINPFLLQTGYDAIEIASISKFFGTIMIIVGGIISGPIITKLGTRRSLISFSSIHVIAHLLFIILAFIGKNIQFLYFLTAYEALTSGMVMTVYIYFISSLCKGKYVATQYALLSSGIGFSRVLFPVASGVLVDYYGWLIFFVIISLISVFAVLFTWLLPKDLYQIK